MLCAQLVPLAVNVSPIVQDQLIYNIVSCIGDADIGDTDIGDAKIGDANIGDVDITATGCLD